MKDKDTEIEKLAEYISDIVASWGFAGLDKLTKINQINQWLRNFRADEIFVVSRLLPRIDLQRDVQIELCLDKICSMVKSEFGSEMANVHFFDISGHPASSGSQFLYKIKAKLGLRDRNFPRDLASAPGDSNTYIFVDDFIGSGRQATDFYNSKLAHLTIPCQYYSLYGYDDGIQFIHRNAGFTKVSSAEELTIRNRIFSNEFNLEFSDAIRGIAQAYGEKLYPKHPLGYENSQSAIVFIDNCPNNTLPIVWAGSNNEKEPSIFWNPLFERKKRKNTDNPSDLIPGDVNGKYTASRARTFKSRPQDLVGYFYEKIISKEYNEAFNCLSESFVERRYVRDFGLDGYNRLSSVEKRDIKASLLDRFEEGYKNTIALTPPAILTAINENMHKRYVVYYKEKQKIYKYKNLIGLYKKKFKDFGEIQSDIEEFVRLLTTEFGVAQNKIDDISYQLFFSPNVIEDVCWTCGIPHYLIESKFHWAEQTVITAKYVDVVKIGKEWFIENFSFVNHSGEYWEI